MLAMLDASDAARKVKSEMDEMKVLMLAMQPEMSEMHCEVTRPGWNSSLYMSGVEPWDKLTAVREKMSMPWMSKTRIEQYEPGMDFTGHHLDGGGGGLDQLEEEGKRMMDLRTGWFLTIDYVHGHHGCFDIAQCHDISYAIDYVHYVSPWHGEDEDVFCISMLDAWTGNRVLTAVINCQRRMRRFIEARSQLQALKSTCKAVAESKVLNLMYQQQRPLSGMAPNALLSRTFAKTADA
jgi:hypothetical protein